VRHLCSGMPVRGTANLGRTRMSVGLLGADGAGAGSIALHPPRDAHKAIAHERHWRDRASKSYICKLLLGPSRATPSRTTPVDVAHRVSPGAVDHIRIDFRASSQIQRAGWRKAFPMLYWYSNASSSVASQGVICHFAVRPRCVYWQIVWFAASSFSPPCLHMSKPKTRSRHNKLSHSFVLVHN
jgi:hypothetical protein